MAWKSLHTNIPYGFSGKLNSGMYTIGDIEMLKIENNLDDGIWINDKGQSIAILTTGLGYYKIHNSKKDTIRKGGVIRKIVVVSTELVFGSIDSYVFNSDESIDIKANEIYGTIKISLNQEDIKVEFIDPADSSDDEDILF